MRNVFERRKEILSVMNIRRHDTVLNLAFEFGVNEKTIRRDIEALSCDAPIYTTCGRHGGGVHMLDGCAAGRKYLSDKQEALLQQLLLTLDAEDAETMRGLLKSFAVPKKCEVRVCHESHKIRR